MASGSQPAISSLVSDSQINALIPLDTTVTKDVIFRIEGKGVTIVQSFTDEIKYRVAYCNLVVFIAPSLDPPANGEYYQIITFTENDSTLTFVINSTFTTTDPDCVPIKFEIVPITGGTT